MKVLVTGALGHQGRAVIEHLRSGEFGRHEVYGLASDLSSPRARNLLERGVHVVEGELHDRTRMRALLEGVDGVFCVTTSAFDPGTETEQARSVVDAAVDAGVSHIVYSSVSQAKGNLPTSTQSKFAVEEHIRDAGLPATIVRSPLFMQHFRRLSDDTAAGSLELPLSPETTLPLVDANDIGRAAAAAFADPGQFVGATIDLVGDALTPPEIAETFSDALGVPVEFTPITLSEYREQHGDEPATVYEWFEDSVPEDVTPDLSAFGLVPQTLAQYLADVDTDTWRSTPPTANNEQ
ncbi:NmrA family protein [Haloferax elongans ATCC BAA-1513]|uniref:NmrA family protein n=1 Tax=Haloferax elongans ATCC BAA-1513 TaxID=1230453 RepID=M0HUK6_HALEO|nr:NmrA/HSCARG family protein [Haloferax elongans]ELZ88166.1 NmrA family protein [Haloferax elongans ATCC BAA-1513]